MTRLPAFPVARTLHWRDWLAPRSFDAVLLCIYVLVVGNYLVLWIGTAPWWQVTLLVGATALLLALDRWECFTFSAATPARSTLLLLVLRLMLIGLIAKLDGFDKSPFLYLILPLTASLSLGRRAGYVAGVGAWVIVAVSSLLTSPDFTTARNDFIVFTMIVLLMLTIGGIVLQEQVDRQRAERLLDELEQSHRQLAAAAQQAGELAVAHERNRIARDIHDSLGHYLTGMKIQLERADVFFVADAAQARQAMQSARHLAHEALDAVRQSVGILRETAPPVSLTAALHALAESARSERLAVTLAITGDADALDAATGVVVQRVVQEGLTNIRRHAQARYARIALNVTPEQATLIVSDDGVGMVWPPGSTAEGGRTYGLHGLHERLALVGGTCCVTSAPGRGTMLTATVPTGAPLAVPTDGSCEVI